MILAARELSANGCNDPGLLLYVRNGVVRPLAIDRLAISGVGAGSDCAPRSRRSSGPIADSQLLGAKRK